MVMSECQLSAAMKPNTTNTSDKNIVIPIQVERVKLWARRTLEATTWMISLGLLAASAVVACGAFVVWLISGSETILAFGGAAGLALGLTGILHLLQRIDRTVKRLKPQAM